VSVAAFFAAAVALLQAPRPPVVRVAEPTAVVVAPGGKAQARISVTIAPGFHVQANPASQPNLIPLRLALKERPPLRVGDSRYPPGKSHRLQGSEFELSVYDGTIELGVSIEAAKDAAPVETALEGSLRYQACDDRVCLRPQELPVRLPVRVTGP
jgi:hypothetical protein